ncbi:ABC transporter ATP-binding protein [Flavobacterium dankookense]|uniref:ABC-type polysaccharide/polyol phosphate transport system ATPase subunit n=1 Tax=Flavobacterium dankookense TaxID=706186 RepID=A0A4R6Q9E1_9FLAO|nr:ABC transporter ATP-binding protein [Flavobacterium dankookense]TDP59208.1 ABC-type polysaccharide/polyol phosphate transport system ATPase subunit [Flavobacterium dankookense]
MSNKIIKVENLSKAYQIGQIGTGTISKDLERFWVTKVLGKEDPFLRIGETNDRSVKGESNIVWSLRDINFEINQGDAVGIIGKNGAGKSTLLKLLSRVTSPTTGEIKVKGRIASLLEVGTGFHPELTGRENVYLNGAILGMRKKEITRKLDEIIDFSGVERYIDTPVKRYSSGMYVRLAFAVAAHLESEILIVDEVLAVGDAEFQKKCLGKMSDISKGQGRTVLFVSHNMAAVKSLCNSGIVLENGKVVYQGESDDAVNFYLSNSSKTKDISLQNRLDRLGNLKLKVVGVDFLNDKNQSVTQVISGELLKVRLHIEKRSFVDLSKLFVGIAFFDNQENRVLSFFSDEMASDFTNLEKSNYIELNIPKFFIRAGGYDLTIQLSDGSTRADSFIDVVEKAAEIFVLPGDIWQTGKTNRAGTYAVLPGFFES